MARKVTDGLRLKANGVWVREEVINGKRCSFSSKDPKKVWEKYRSYRESVDKGLRFSDMAQRWWETKLPTLAPNSRNGYEVAVRRAADYFGDCALDEITATAIHTYLRRLSAAHRFSRSTTSHHLVVVTQIFEYACNHHGYDKNPAQLVKLPDGLTKSRRTMPDQEIIERIKAAKDTPDGRLYFFLLCTGLRIGEALALQWKDLDPQEGTIRVAKSLCWAGHNQGFIKSPKSAKSNRSTLYMTRLQEVMEPSRGDPELYVFGGDEPMTKKAYYCQLRRCRDLGMDTTPHELRHAFATLCFEADLPARTLQGLLGHAQLSTSADVYAEIRTHKLLQDAERLNAVDF